MKLYKVGILGATGAVGREMMKILAERQFPISELRLFASSRSAGKVVVCALTRISLSFALFTLLVSFPPCATDT